MKYLKSIRLASRSGVELVISRSIELDSRSETQLATGVYGVIDEEAEHDAIPEMIWDAQDELFQPIQLLEETRYECEITLPMCVDNVMQQRKLGTKMYPFQNEQLENGLIFNNRAASDYGASCRLFGTLHIKGYSGRLDLSIDGLEVDAIFEVRTKKVGYKDEFHSLLDSLAVYHQELVLNLNGLTSTLLSALETEEVSKQAIILHLRRLMRDGALPDALSVISSCPAFKFKSNLREENVGIASDVEFMELATNPHSYDWVSRGALSKQFFGFSPKTVPEKAIYSSYDIPENRYVLAKVESLIDILNDLEQALGSNGASGLRNSISRWIDELRHFSSKSVFADIGRTSGQLNSVVMLRRNGYREFFEAMLLFDLGLAFGVSAGELEVDGSLKQVSELYQIWCFFVLNETLEDLCGPPSKPISHILADGEFHVSLQRGKNCYSEFKYSNLTIKLHHTKQFRAPRSTDDYWDESYSSAFEPDFTLELIFESKSRSFIFFDAKYRLNGQSWDHQISDVDNKSGTFKREDLHVMHCYRDAVLNSFGSYVLFPGSAQSRTFSRHHFAEQRNTLNLPSVGAFPLKPDSRCQSDQMRTLKTFIRDVIDELIHIHKGNA